jgi:hypothetical protein
VWYLKHRCWQLSTCFLNSVNWWQQLLPGVRCGNLLAMRRTHARAGAISVCDVPSIHSPMPPDVNTFTWGGAHIGGAHAGAHIPGAQLPGRTCRGDHAGAHMPGGAPAGGASGHKPTPYTSVRAFLFLRKSIRTHFLYTFPIRPLFSVSVTLYSRYTVGLFPYGIVDAVPAADEYAAAWGRIYTDSHSRRMPKTMQRNVRET